MQIEPKFFYTFASGISNAKALRLSTSSYRTLAHSETYTNQVWF
jgi:hypothetical protein